MVSPFSMIYTLDKIICLPHSFFCLFLFSPYHLQVRLDEKGGSLQMGVGGSVLPSALCSLQPCIKVVSCKSRASLVQTCVDPSLKYHGREDMHVWNV